MKQVSDMMRATQVICIQIADVLLRVVQTIFHYIIRLVYWNERRKVPSVRDPILLMSATDLAKQIREGKMTSESVVRAYIRRILIVEPFINATVDRRFNEALQEAREVDALIKSGTVNKLQLAKEKPLLGVPFTTKVLLTVKGLRSTGGSMLFKDVRAQNDASVVARMKNAGAIVLASTNSAEIGMNFETNNNLHGITCNPYDTSKTSGGSSGGESALLAASGSVIGLGNDMAGSIRIPCMFCGLFGHKPTRGLVSNEGCFPAPVEGMQHIVYSGPMCRYATDLVTMMKILASPKKASDMFDREVTFENLKIYYLYSFGDITFVEKVDPDIRKCVEKVVSYFETKHGSKSKELNIPLFRKSNRIYIHDLLSSVPDISKAVTAGKVDVDETLELLKFLFRQSQFSLGCIVTLNCHSIPFLYKEELVQHYEKLMKQLDNELNNFLDETSVLVMPTLPFAAPYHHEISLRIASSCYTSIFNSLGHPATQCPVGFNRNGLPVGVQIVGRRGNDHLTVACAVELEKAFGGWTPPTA